MLNNQPPLPTNKQYYSFLLRCWQEQPTSAWRASLQCVQTGEVIRFTSVEALMGYLQQQLHDERQPTIVLAPADDHTPSPPSILVNNEVV